MMKSFLPIFTLSCLITLSSFGQTNVRAYQILQENCASCHSNANPASGLDLEGSASTETLRALQVRTNLVNVNPSNAHAVEAGYKYVVPGRPDLSYLFRSIQDGLEPIIKLDEAELEHSSLEGSPELTVEEKEFLRQWILFGARTSGSYVDEDLIDDYYNNFGMPSFPDGPPEAPTAEEGFQIKMGPFFLEPGGELEYFQKYQLNLPDDVDVTRIEIFMSSFSHHFILYDFNAGGSNSIPAGLRLDPDHSEISLVAAVQEPTNLKLPNNTAFIWDKDLVLDLNSHYINYSATNAYMGENYINVYTAPAGSAAQEMKTELIVNGDIYIPNNGNEIVETQHVNPNIGEVFLWGIMGHTHQYGTGYKAWKRNSDGSAGELIYDAACANGEPGCVSPFFDYQHIPMRYFEPLSPININFSSGLIHEAKWVNNGPQDVWFGPTSDDEMMVLVLMYTEDTVGLATSIRDIDNPLEAVKVFPNPVLENATVQIPADVGPVQFTLFDSMGRVQKRLENIREPAFTFNSDPFVPGIYFYRIEDNQGRFSSGKLIIK